VRTCALALSGDHCGLVMWCVRGDVDGPCAQHRFKPARRRQPDCPSGPYRTTCSSGCCHVLLRRIIIAADGRDVRSIRLLPPLSPTFPPSPPPTSLSQVLARVDQRQQRALARNATTRRSAPDAHAVPPTGARPTVGARTAPLSPSSPLPRCLSRLPSCAPSALSPCPEKLICLLPSPSPRALLPSLLPDAVLRARCPSTTYGHSMLALPSPNGVCT